LFCLQKNQERLFTTETSDRTYSLLDQVDTDDQLYGFENILLSDYHSLYFMCRDLQSAYSKPKEVKVGGKCC
jgi:hypothetical protein